MIVASLSNLSDLSVYSLWQRCMIFSRMNSDPNIDGHKSLNISLYIISILHYVIFIISCNNKNQLNAVGYCSISLVFHICNEI